MSFSKLFLATFIFVNLFLPMFYILATLRNRFSKELLQVYWKVINFCVFLIWPHI